MKPRAFTLIELLTVSDGATVSDRCGRRAASPVCFVRGEECCSSSATAWRPSLRQARHSAFTLIELLTVIAIIGILAAIIIPVTASVRQKARAAKCVATIRQWGTATQLYLQDYKDVLPETAYGKANCHTTLAPYLGYTGNPTPGELANRGMGCTSPNTKHGFNAFLSAKPIRGVSQPSRHIWAIDLKNIKPDGTTQDNRWLDATILNGTGGKDFVLKAAVPKAHSGRVSVLYLDGHAALKKVSEIMRADVNRDFGGVPADETTPIGDTQYDQ